MGFHNAIFPEDMSYGTRIGPGWRTLITESDSGYEVRLSKLQQPRIRVDVAESVKTDAQRAALLSFARARHGAAYAFRFKDWTDYTTAPTHVDIPEGSFDPTNNVTDRTLIAAGDGNETVFQLVKRYTDSGVERIRTITKPRTGTVQVFLDGVEKTEGPDYTVDHDSGLITFATAPAGAVQIDAGFRFDVPARFGEEVDELLAFGIAAFDSSETTLPIVEVPDLLEYAEETFWGGATSFSMSANRQIERGQGRLQYVTDATSAGLELALPQTTGFVAGGPHFYVVVSGSSSNGVTITAPTGGSLAVAAGETANIHLTDTGVWLAVLCG